MVLENYGDMLSLLISPTKTFENKRNMPATEGIKNMILAVLPLFIIYVIIAFFLGAGAGLVVLILGAILLPIYITSIMGSVGTLHWGISRLLGNEASLDEFVGMFGLYLSGMLIGSYIASIMCLITIIVMTLISPVIAAIFAGLMILAVMIYAMYVYYKMLTVGMGMNRTGALVMVLLPILLLIAFAIIMAVGVWFFVQNMTSSMMFPRY